MTSATMNPAAGGAAHGVRNSQSGRVGKSEDRGTIDFEQDVIVAEIRKNSRETFRVQVRSFKGNRFVDLRVYTLNGTGDFVPTGKGIAIKADAVGEILVGLRKAGAVLDTDFCGRAHDAS
ncbi:MAG TPA: transcriptional coactivator p15/PC4 family protein [Beijerinckiaceae bacterium]|jgi:hypothetical protein|nr:transcriptional coactivator p15/PC4 family protein [Beijerinckiaceae bacterium]